MITRLYEISPRKSGWARIWITDDGSFSCLSDWGNFGYWWGAAGCEFRQFLIGCDDDYLGNKFSGGRSEYDGDGTEMAIKRVILRKRREQRISAEEARMEWRRLGFCDLETPVGLNDWSNQTTLSVEDYHETPRYVIPHKVRMFLKNVWPLFVGKLRAELAQEVEAAIPCAPSISHLNKSSEYTP